MLILELARRFWTKGLPDLGAQVAFYLILAFFPFLMLLLHLLALTPLADVELLLSQSWILPETTYLLVVSVAEELTTGTNLTLVSLSVLISVWIASRGMLSLEKAVNVSFGITKGRPLLLKLLFSMVFTVVLLMAIQISFVGLVLGQTIGSALVESLELPDYFLPLWNLIRYAVSLFFMVMVVTILYMGLPHKPLRMGQVLPGALLTTAGWVLISQLFSSYVNRFAHYSYIYGSLGAVVGLILWLYLCAMVFLLGAELDALLLDRKKRMGR